MVQKVDIRVQLRISGCYGDDRCLILGFNFFSFEFFLGNVYFLVVGFSGYQGVVCGQVVGYIFQGLG